MKTFTNSAKAAVTDKITSMQSPSKFWVSGDGSGEVIKQTTAEVIYHFTNMVQGMIDDKQIDLNDFDSEKDFVDYLFKNAMRDGSLFDYCTCEDYADAVSDAKTRQE